MKTNSITGVLDEIMAGQETSSDLAESIPSWTAQDLARALDEIRKRTGLANDSDTVSRLMRLTAEILYLWSRTNDSALAGSMAGVAAEVFDSDLNDDSSAEKARMVAAVRGFNPGALSSIYDLIQDQLPDPANIRLLQLLAGLGDARMNAKYGPLLRNAIEKRNRLSTQIPQKMAKPLTEQTAEQSEAHELTVEPTLAGEQALPIVDSAQQTPRPDSRQVAEPDFVPQDTRDYQISVFEARLTQKPDDVEALSSLVTGLVDVERYADAELKLIQSIPRLRPIDRSRFQAIMGRIQLENLNLPERAGASFEVALETDPHNVMALEGFAKIATLTGETQKALNLLENLRVGTSGQSDEAIILPILANIYSSIGQTETAEKTWRRLRAINPRSIDALRFYDIYHENRGDYSKQFTTLQFMLSIVESPSERIAINKKMAELAMTKLGNQDRAIEAFKRVIAIDPNSADSATELVRLYETTHKWHALVEFYNEKLRRLPANASDKRIETLFRIIEIYQSSERLPNPENVLATYARIVEISPTHKEALETLARGYEDRERWPDLLKILQKKVDMVDDPVELLDLFQQISEIAIERMSNETQAIPFLEKMLELDPSNLQVVQRLKVIYQHKHNQEKLYAMNLRELKMVTGPQREEVLLAAATIARDRLLRYEDSLGLFEELYNHNNTLRVGRENLHQLYARLDRWDDYSRFLAEEIERPMPDKRRIELLHKLGEVLADRLGRHADARKVLERVLKIDPSDETAGRRLEQIYLDEDDLIALFGVFELRKDPRSYVSLLAQREAKEPDPMRRIRWNLSMAQVCEDVLAEPGRAFRYLEKAFSLDNTQVDTGKRLLEHYEKQQDIKRVVETLRELAPAISDPVDRLDIQLRLHDVMVIENDILAAFQAGASAVQTAIMIGRGDDVLNRIRDTAESGALWADFATLLDDVATATMDPDVRLRLLMEEGNVYENRLLFHDEARAVMEQVLDLDPGNLVAMDALEDIALQREDYAGLESVLRRRIDVASDPTEARDIRMRLGRLYEDLVGDDDSAADCYVLVVGMDPEDREALAGLHRTYEHGERYIELADVIRMEIQSATSDWGLMRLHLELARILFAQLDDHAEAVNVLVSCLEVEPGHDEATDILREIFDSGHQRERIAEIVEPIYLDRGNFKGILYLFDELIRDRVEPWEKAVLLMKKARVQSELMGNSASAFKDVLAAVSLSVTEESAKELILLGREIGRLAEATAAIGAWLGIGSREELEMPKEIADPALEGSLSLLLGRVFAVDLDQPQLAITALEKALLFEGNDPALLRLLLDAYRRVVAVDSALMIFDRLAESPGEIVAGEVLFEKAQYARDNGREDSAISALEVILNSGPDSPADALLADILSSSGRYPELVTALQRRLRRASGLADSVEIRFDITTIWMHHLNLLAEVAEGLNEILLDAPEHEGARAMALDLAVDSSRSNYSSFAPSLLSAIESVYRADGLASSELISILRAKVDLTQSDGDAIDLLQQISSCHSEMGDPVAAYEADLMALARVPTDSDLLDSTMALAIEAGRISEFADSLEGIASSTDTETGVRLLLATAELVRERLDDADRAMMLYERLLEIDPSAHRVLQAMDDLLASQKRNAERIPLLNEMAQVAHTVEERRATHVKIGDLCEITGDFDGAIRSFRYVLDLRPSEDGLDQLARQAVERLLYILQKNNQFKEFVDLHLQSGQLADEPVIRRDHRLSAARTLRDQLDDTAEALNIFEMVIGEFPDLRDVRAEAEAVAFSADQIDRLINLVNGRLNLATSDQERLEPMVDLARIHVTSEGGDLFEAVPLLRAALQIDPTSNPAMDLAVGLLADPTHRADVADFVYSAAVTNNDDPLIARALAVLAETSEDSVNGSERYLELFAALSRLSRDDDALTAIKQGFLRYPENIGIYDAMSDAYEAHDCAGDMLGITVQAGESITSAEERIDLRVRAATWLFRVGLIEDAATLLQFNIHENDGHVQSLDMLLSALENLSLNEKLVGVLELRARVEENPNRRVDYLLRGGQIAKNVLKDTKTARQLLLSAIDTDIFKLPAMEELCALLSAEGDEDAIRDIRRQELARRETRGLEDDRERIAELRRLLAMDHLGHGQPDEAKELSLRLLAEIAINADDVVVAHRVFAEVAPVPELFHALTGAYERLNDLEGLLGLYRFTAVMDLPDPSIEECLRSAVLLEAAMGRHEDLFDDLLQLALVAPDDGNVWDRLIASAQNSKRIDDVIDAQLQAFGRGQDEPWAFDLASSIATLLRDEKNDLNQAADYLRIAFLRRPQDRPTIDELADIYLRMERFSDLALLYENVGDLDVRGDVRTEMYFKAFDILRTRLDNPDGASSVLRKVLDLEPENRNALNLLEAIARETGNLDDLANWLQRKMETSHDQKERRDLAIELAGVFSGGLGDDSSAIDVLTATIDEFPKATTLYRHLEQILVKTSQSSSLAELLEREADTSDNDADRIAAMHRAAKIRHEDLEDNAGAIQILQRILQISPPDTQAFDRLSEILSSNHDYDHLAELLLRRLSREEVSAQRARLSARLGHVLAHNLFDPIAACEQFKSAIALDPFLEDARKGLNELLGEPQAAMEAAITLEGVYESGSEFGNLVGVLGAELDIVETTHERSGILLRIAEIELERLKQPAPALTTLGKALSLNPADGDVLKRMLDVCEAHPSLWESCLSTISPLAVNSHDADVRQSLHRAAADIAENRLHNISVAATHLEALVQDSRQDVGLLDRLDAIFEELKRPDDQARIIKLRIGLEGPAADPQIRLKLATLLSNESRDFEGAIEQLRLVLDGDPRNAEAVRLISTLISDTVVGRQAMEILVRAFERSKDNEGLLWATERQIESTADATEMFNLRLRGALAAGNLRKFDSQMTHLGEALVLVPSDESISDRILKLAQQEDMTAEAFNYLNEASKAAGWPELERELVLMACENAPANAVADGRVSVGLKRVLDIDPENSRALDMLDRIYLDEGRIGDLANILDRKLELQLHGDARKDVLSRLASIRETRKEWGLASKALEELAGLCPSDREVLVRLEVIYRNSNDVEGRVQTLQSLATIEPNRQDKIERLLDAAGLLETVLEDQPAARGILEQILEIDPTHGSARIRLEALYEDLGEYDPLMKLLMGVVDSDTPRAERVDAAMRAGSIAETYLNNLAQAVSLVRRALEIDPESEGVIDELVRLYFRNEDWNGLVGILRRKATLTTGSGERLALLTKACDVAAEHLSDPTLTAGLAREILAIDSNNAKAILLLGRLLETREQQTEALNLYRKLTAIAIDEDEKFSALLGISRIMLALGQSAEEVKETLESAAAIHPDHPEVNQHLKDVFMDTGDHRRVIDVLTRELKRCSDDGERARIAMDIAGIYLNQLDDGSHFLEWAEEAHRFRKDDPHVVAGIVNYHLKSSAPQRAIPYLEWLVNYLEAKRRLKELPGYAHELGRLFEASGDVEKAARYYRICHDHDAGHLQNSLALGQLHMTAGDSEKALRIYQPLLLKIDAIGAEASAEVLMALARIHQARGDKRKAEQFVLRILSTNPNHPQARDLLKHL